MKVSVPGLWLLIGSLLFVQSGSSIKLHSDGGYEITVAVDESTALPSVGANSYINNMKTSLRAFSSRLWVATKNHFYLKSVDILVPTHWNVDSASAATTQNYKNADIRLSNTTYPYTDNPNVCGLPGNFIDLPSSFFTATHSGPYGLHWKSLLHTWAMYRFGVHPEHGYIGDSNYPYATRNAQSNHWTVTGCSDAPIQGNFVDITNPDVTGCGSEATISNNCRFVPTTTGQNATTSLMYFHWIESVTEFCDEDNHNVHAPNKQNALCNHKSVWQVIRESPDYLAVTSPRNSSVPAVTIRTVKHSSTPLFYILLDRGLVQGSYGIANNIPRLLSSLVTDNALVNTVTSVGVFPGDGTNPVSDLVQWSELGANRNEFLDAIGVLRADGPLERDFSRALVAVAEKIKATNHPNGAVALLIKYGADTKSFGSYLPEPEVFNAFNEGNIILNSIELNFADHTGYSHLAKTAQETGGSYVTLNNFGEAETNIRNVLNYVRRTLITEYTDLRKNWLMLRKELLTTSTIIPVPSDVKGSLQIFVSSSNPNLSAANFSIADIDFRFSKNQDWNEEGSKFTYKLEVPENQLEGLSQISLSLLCGAGCSSNVLARAQHKGESQIRIEVSTSLENDHVDLSNGRPVSIFVKVTKSEIPVQDAFVVATLTETQSMRTTYLRLLDDGALAPDVQELDGVYSAYFAPENDGNYRLSVAVQGNPSRVQAHRKLNESSFTRLLPIDQEDVGCGAASCESETIEGNFSQTVELTSTFSVTQASLYTPAPTKILSLMAVDNPVLGQVTLYWQSPNIPGRLHTVSSYELRSAPSFESLISNFEDQTEVPVPPNFRPKPPISMEMISVDRPASTTYYAVRSVYRGNKSPVSNIVPVIMGDQETTTTPTSTPSVSTSNPSSTTSDETSTPSSTSTLSTDPSSSSDPSSSTDPSSSSPSSSDPSSSTDPSSSSPSSSDPSSSTDPSSSSPSSSDPSSSTDPSSSADPSSSTDPSPTTTTTTGPSTSPSNNNTGAPSRVKTVISFILPVLIVFKFCIISS